MNNRQTQEEDREGTPFANLTPETVLDAVESLGYRTDGRFFALNSFENRVYQLGIEEGEPLIAKFYRANRWSDDAIKEEHTFTQELADHEIPVVAPIATDGETLHHYGEFRFALFPRKPGRTPELEDLDTLTRIGRFMGRLHSVGRAKPFKHRPALTPVTFGEESLKYLLDGRFIPDYLEESYKTVAEEVIRRVKIGYGRGGFDSENPVGIRLHGDCHPGNILWTDSGPHFVDMDDCRTGPGIQDLWMLLTGDRVEKQIQLDAVLEGYTDFADFDPKELHLIEPLRGLRMLHHAAWLAKRKNDPAFLLGFPWFNTAHYWEGQVLGLREQAAALDEEVLKVE